ncbi:MAG: hypothetical protein JXR96_22125 [Deltaproteobacteria bacterium]|nr:hypothetical protein [Deltaproteobacteria bacterium]
MLLRALAFCLLSGAVLLACTPAADTGCTDTDPCIEGYTCNPDGVCVTAGALSIDTQKLPDGAVGVGYDCDLDVSGGLSPYRWSLESGPGWMQIDDRSGRLSGQPTEAGTGIGVRVEVRDSSYGQGQSAEQAYSINVFSCFDGSTRECYVSPNGYCEQGTQACEDGRWGDCEVRGPSERFDLCGPDCEACDPERADVCIGGQCTCNGSPACEGSQLCCDRCCTDVRDSLQHCGRCGHNCQAQVQNAFGVECRQGACTYASCRSGFLDCDGDRENGCETAVDLEHCGACDRSCEELEHVVALRCDEEGDGSWVCAFERCHEDYLDCDPEAPGCETARDEAHCESCEDSCSASTLGLRCVKDADSAAWHCGCADAQVFHDCGNFQQCCAQICTALDDPAHCGSCEFSCFDYLVHAAGIDCDYPSQEIGFLCTMSGCDTYYLDCDPIAPGCETRRDAEHCTSCEDGCSAGAQDRNCVFDRHLQDWRCGCLDESACAAGQLCCDKRCVPRDSPVHCGVCFNACLGLDGRTSHCVDPDRQLCGCLEKTDCLARELCCEHRCIMHDDSNCGDCGHACTIERGGPHCNPFDIVCGCSEDAECRGFAGSAQVCVPIDGLHGRTVCKCGDSGTCPETLESVCCWVDGARECADLSSDPANCGRCALHCQGGCERGGCVCADGPCPGYGPGTVCDPPDTGICHCPPYSETEPCPEGRSCCLGNLGGSGGPGGGPDEGCCVRICGENQPGDCEY